MVDDAHRRFAVIEFSTPKLSFAEDLAVYRAAGAAGIGISEAKLTDDARDLARLQESGLHVTSAFPASPAILPARLLPGPREPAARLADLRRSMERLAPFRPDCFSLATGPTGDFEPGRARELVVEGLRELACGAADLGMVVAVETMPPSLAAEFSWVNTITEVRALLRDVGEPNVRISLDAGHLMEAREPLATIRDSAAEIVTLHICDRRDEPRGWQDRLFPGDGVVDTEGILGSLDAGGFTGWFEMEVLSDEALPDSLWRLEPVEFVRICRERFEAAWLARRRDSPEGATARR